jgi:tetratricopeptide (TPR) repeat protein
VEPLLAAINDADAGVRYRVVEALGELKQPQAEAALTAALTDPEEAVREVASWSLKQLQAGAASADEAAPVKEEALAASAQEEVVTAPVQEAEEAGKKEPVSMEVPPAPAAAPEAEAEPFHLVEAETAAPLQEAVPEAERPQVAPPKPVEVPPMAEPPKAGMFSLGLEPLGPLPEFRVKLEEPSASRASGTITLEVKPYEAEAHHLLGLALSESGNWAEAIASYKKAIKLKPDLAEAYCNLGVAYSQQGQLQEALIFLKQALKLKPDLSRTACNLGEVQAALGHWPEAVESFQHALRLHPGDPEVLKRLGAASSRLGRWPEAALAFKQALQSKPDDTQITYNLGLVYCHLGHWPEAVRALQQVLALRPDHAPAFRHLGIACNQLGNWKEAVRCFQQEVLIKPENTEAYLNLGGMFAQVVNWQESVQAFKRAVQAKPDHAMAHQALGVAYGQLGLWREAAEAFQRAILLGDNADAARYGSLAPPLADRGEEMAENLRHALRYNPNLAEAQYLLGLVQGQMGRWQEAAIAFANVVRKKTKAPDKDQSPAPSALTYYKEAMDILRQAIDLRPDLPELASGLLLETGSLAASQNQATLWERGIQANPKNEEAHYQLGLTHLRLGCYPEAIAAFKALVQINPQHALGHYQLAVAYLSSGDFGAAVEEYAELKKLDENLAAKLFG